MHAHQGPRRPGGLVAGGLLALTLLAPAASRADCHVKMADAHDERCWSRVKLNVPLDKALAKGAHP